MFQSVFVALVGSPNVGKSTLMNALVGAKVAIVSKKAQTTRSRITGILNGDGWQMVFLDTPGIAAPKNALGEYMVRTAEQTARDVDVVLFLADAKTGIRERDEGILARLSKNMPVIVALNKVDAVDRERVTEVRKSLEPYGWPVYEISALEGQGLDALKEALAAYMQESPMYYPEEMVTDQPARLMAAELIREKALKSLGKEIPHGLGVIVEKFSRDEGKGLLNIDAVIYTEKESHKGIVIGAGGKMLKKIASLAREEMEELFDSKVFLQVWVKVKPDWRNKQGVLRDLGYSSDGN